MHSLHGVYVQDLETNSKCSLLIARDASDISDTVVTIIGEAETVSPCRSTVHSWWYYSENVLKEELEPAVWQTRNVVQISDAEWESVRSIYLRKHPDAFWVRVHSPLYVLLVNVYKRFRCIIYLQVIFVNRFCNVDCNFLFLIVLAYLSTGRLWRF